MFEMLTNRTEGGIAYTKIPMIESHLNKRGAIEQCFTGFVADRLAAYEDSGLSPEEVQELAKARNLIGKTVYCVFAGVNKVIERKIHGLEVNSNREVLLAENGKKDYYLAEISAVGKTIFLTREAAEKAIGGKEDGK